MGQVTYLADTSSPAAHLARLDRNSLTGSAIANKGSPTASDISARSFLTTSAGGAADSDSASLRGQAPPSSVADDHNSIFELASGRPRIASDKLIAEPLGECDQHEAAGYSPSDLARLTQRASDAMHDDGDFIWGGNDDLQQQAQASINENQLSAMNGDMPSMPTESQAAPHEHIDNVQRASHHEEELLYQDNLDGAADMFAGLSMG